MASTRMTAGAATSFGLGWAEKSGRLAQVPQIFGLPRTVTLAVAAKVAELYGTGKTREVAAGVADAAAAVAIYQFAAGRTVMGDAPQARSIEDERREVRRLIEQTQRSAREEMGDDALDDALAEAMGEDDDD